MLEWEAPLSGAECKRRRMTSYLQVLLQGVGNGLLTPVKCLIGKLQRPRFPEQQRRIQLSHLTDVIPQQGDPLQLAQVLAAVHPELEGTKG